ncbi:MAG TPA: hypothetical protein DCS66_10165, partial [Flavobacteriaceae bacterium]|nr:hypothetical protein [Flavobacteriaceae bacterium]
GLAGLPVVRRAAGNVGTQGDFEFDEQVIVQNSAYPSILPTQPVSFPPRNLQTVTQEQIIKPRPEYDVQKVSVIENARTNLQRDLSKKTNKELDDMDKKYFDGRFSRLGAGSTFQRGGIIQAVISLIASSPAGALAGAMEGLPGALKELGALEASETKEIGKVEKEQYGVKRVKLKERKKEQLAFINRDADMSRLYDQLPGKARDAFLKEWATIETRNLKADEIQQKIKAALAKAAMDGKKFKQRLEEFALKKDKFGVDQAKIPQLIRDLMYVDPESAVVSLAKAKFTQAEIEKVFKRVVSKGAGTSGPATVLSTGAKVDPTRFSLKDIEDTLKAIQ